jgi:signal transduction histidine kinase/ligand-binding sensor protein
MQGKGDSMTTTKFEKIIGNPRIFSIILDEFFRDRPGSYDIMPAESPEDRQFKDHTRMVKFCLRVRSSEEGLRRCMNCDIENAELAKDAVKPMYYMCHAGLMDIAVPIIVDNELIATIFCGQNRSNDKELEKEATKKTLAIETELGYKKGELLKLRKEAPTLSYEQAEEVKNKLWEIATYVSNLGSSKLEAEKARRDLAYRLVETESIQKILLELSGALYNIDAFWQKLDKALDKICEIIGASFALFVVCEKDIKHENVVGHIKSASATLHRTMEKGCLTFNSHTAISVAEIQPITIDLQREDAFSDFLKELEKTYPNKDLVDKAAVIPVRLDPEHLGAMILFILSSRDIIGGVAIKDEVSLLTQAATQIATAYGNCILYEKQKELADIQNEWLENVSHQILAPINGILGQTENLSRQFRVWQKSNPQRIDNTLITIVELSDWATRMAKNFAWAAQGVNRQREIAMRLEDDVPGRLIGYARNVQGLARTQGISRVHVDIDSVKWLNSRIVIDNKLFKQAVMNLLDNAVKYASRKTEVTLMASISTIYGCINVIDYGLPIREYEVEEIFNRYYRTKEAREIYSVGSGIGLGIAREIMRLHGGDLVVTPSIQTDMGWKTTFVISLPLK